MTSKRSQLIAFSKAVKAPTDKKKGFWAVLGTLDGVVLTGAPNLVYVTTFEGQTIAVINRRVPNQAGSVVFVGSDDYSANKIEVLYTLNVNGTNDGTSNQSNIIPPHDHSYGSLNVTWVYDAQFIPLLALPVQGTLTVQIYPVLIRKTNSTGWKYIDDQVVDLSGDMPATGACWAVLQANDDGTVDAVIGSTQADRATLTEADIPEPTTGRGICAVILEAGYTELFRNATRNDFLDMRFDRGGTSDAAGISYSPSNPFNWDYLLDPGQVADALDQLADRAADIETNQTDISSDDANVIAVNFLEQSSDPDAPGADHRILYAKNDGMYERDSAGTIVGPFGEGGTGTGLYASYAKLQNQQNSGTEGGTFTQGSYATRVLNTEVSDADGIVTLSSNQFTLGAGTYRILATAPAFAVLRHKAKLYNITDSADVIIGTNELSNSASGGSETRSIVAGQFTIAGTKTFEIQHRCEATKATNGFGVACTFGDVEVYTVVEIWKEN